MDELSIGWLQTPDGVAAVPEVNGESLIALVRAAELPSAEQSGTPSLAGAYGGLPPAVVRGPSSILLGRSEPTAEGPDPRLYVHGERVTLLACRCGDPGCWPLQARLGLEETRVTWSEFAQPHRSTWNLSRFGPFVFDRAQYEQALEAAGGPANGPGRGLSRTVPRQRKAPG
jgi:hypothetical protein